MYVKIVADARYWQGRIGYVVNPEAILVQMADGEVYPFAEWEIRQVADLTHAASVHFQWLESMSTIDEEMRAFHAPAECGTLAYDHNDRCRAARLEELGWNDRELEAWFKARTNEKTAYRWGLTGITLPEDAVVSSDPRALRSHDRGA